MKSTGRWTEEAALKLRYDPALDPKGRGSYYIWEGGTGFGMRLYRSGRRIWVCATTVTIPGTGTQRSRFFKLGTVLDTPLKTARVAATHKLNAMRSSIDPRAVDAESSRKRCRGRTRREVFKATGRKALTRLGARLLHRGESCSRHG